MSWESSSAVSHQPTALCNTRDPKNLVLFNDFVFVETKISTLKSICQHLKLIFFTYSINFIHLPFETSVVHSGSPYSALTGASTVADAAPSPVLVVVVVAAAVVEYVLSLIHI